MLLAQVGFGVESMSPHGIFILVLGVASTVGLPSAMIEYGRKD